MPINLTTELIETLKLKGVSCLHRPGGSIPDAATFEPPCSFKWMSVNHSIHIGAFSYAVSGFYFAVRIGRYTSIGENVQIGRHSHSMHWFSTSPYFSTPSINILDLEPSEEFPGTKGADFFSDSLPAQLKITHIGNDVWIGHGAFVLPGVKVGNGAVIGAMSVVTKNVPAYAVVAGSPAKVIRYRFAKEQIAKLEASAWWDFAPWQLKGVKVDDVEKFILHIASIRDSGIKVYSPCVVKATDLANGKTL